MADRPDKEVAEKDRNETWGRGYLMPEVAQASVGNFGDKFALDEKHSCFVLLAPTADNIKLVVASDFRVTLNSFIKEMTIFYYFLGEFQTLSELRVPVDHLKTGGIVAVYNETEKEWMRARLEMDEPKGRRDYWKVTTLDTGEEIEVQKSKIYRLHEKFAKHPGWVIQAALPHIVRGAQDWEKQHGTQSRQRWEEEVLSRLCRTVHDKPVRVRFMRKRAVETGSIWDVELQCLETDWEEGKWNPKDPKTLDKRAMSD